MIHILGYEAQYIVWCTRHVLSAVLTGSSDAAARYVTMRARSAKGQRESSTSHGEQLDSEIFILEFLNARPRIE